MVDTPSQVRPVKLTRPHKHLTHVTEQKAIAVLIKGCLSLSIGFLLFTFIIVYSLIALPIYLIKISVFKVFQYWTASNDSADSNFRFLSPMELFWLYDSKCNKSIGSCIFVIEGEYIDFVRVADDSIYPVLRVEGTVQRVIMRDLIKNRIILPNKQNGKRQYARFSSIVAHIWGFGYAWLDAQTFNIEEHLIEISNEHRLENDEDLQKLVLQLRSADLDYRKPLWLLYYKTNYGPDRQTLVIFMYHMCLSDGVSLMRLFFKSLVDDRMALDVKPRYASHMLGLNLFRTVFMAWKQILYRILFSKTERVLKGRKLSGDMRLHWSEPFNFVDANRLKLVTRSSLNDVLMSVLAGSIRAYLRTHHDIGNPSDLSCLVSVNLRSNKFPADLGFKSTLATVALPTNTEGNLLDLSQMLAQIRHSSDTFAILKAACHASGT